MFQKTEHFFLFARVPGVSALSHPDAPCEGGAILRGSARPGLLGVCLFRHLPRFRKKAKQSSVSDARRLHDWACMHSIKGFLKMTLATFKRSLYKAKEKQQNPTFAEHCFHDSFRSLKTFSFFHEAAFYLCIADLYH